jgi:hypothetical protein
MVQSFDGIPASVSEPSVRLTPNLSPNILRAETAPPIGTSINACYESDVGIVHPEKRKILTYSFHSKVTGGLEVSARGVIPPSTTARRHRR